jgi:protein required for attachment to host cells
MKSKRTWILLADGAHARVHMNIGVGKGLEPVPDGTFDEPILPNRDMGTDKPGRTYDSSGKGRHSLQAKKDPHSQAKVNFARQLATFLDTGHADGRFDRLILVAPPEMLGDLRAAISEPVRQLVYGQLAKDLVHLNEQELSAHLTDLLAL